MPTSWENATRVLLPNGTELDVVDLVDLVRLKLRAGGSRDLWDVAELLKRHTRVRESARRWAEELGCSEELDAWLSDPRLG